MGDYREFLAQTAAQVQKGIDIAGGLTIPKNTRRIIVCGMGGSAITGDVLSTILEAYDIEVTVVRAPSIPNYLLSGNTVAIVCSYSGNTQETLSCYRSALRDKARVLVVSSGGVLLASAHRQKIQHITLPQDIQPRESFMHQFFAVLQVCVNSELIPNQTASINEFVKLLDTYPFARRSNAIAKNIEKRLPIIYTSPALFSAAMRWRTQINENAKALCHINAFTELNHNEIEAYDKQMKESTLVILKMERESKYIDAQIEAFTQLIRSQVDILKVYTMPGRSLLASLLAAIHLGDWVSYQLAEMNGVEPGQIDLINQLKSRS